MKKAERERQSEEDNSVNDQECETKDEAQQRKRRTMTVQFCCATEHKMMRLSVGQSATAVVET